MNPRVDAFLDKHWRPLHPISKLLIFMTFCYLIASILIKSNLFAFLTLFFDVITVISLVYFRKKGSKEVKA